MVTFHRLDDAKTKVSVQMDWEAEGIVEQVGGALNFDNRALKSDLERFKEQIEAQGTETGAYRGEVEQDHTR